MTGLLTPEGQAAVVRLGRNINATVEEFEGKMRALGDAWNSAIASGVAYVGGQLRPDPPDPTEES